MVSVSVIIPCFNARQWISATLRSALDQHDVECEVVVVDDGSTDGSAELVEREFPMVQLVRTEHRGPSGARNFGTELARGDFIQYLDADDLLAPGKLYVQLQALDDAHADVAYGDWCELHGSQLGRVVARQIEGPADIALFTDFWSPPAAYLFRRTIVDRVDGWNERLPIVQDARFVLDCALHGARFVYTPGLTAYYRVHDSGSVSTRDRPAFIRDRLHNAASVENWWSCRQQLTPARVGALVKVYGQVARDTFGCDEKSFESALSALERLHPGYVPAAPWHLALASRVFGYRRAEALAVHYRQAKSIIHAAKH